MADPFNRLFVIPRYQFFFLLHNAPQTACRQEETVGDEISIPQLIETARLRAGEPTSDAFPRGAKPVEAAERGHRATRRQLVFPTTQSLRDAWVPKIPGGRL
jgi:hypothetical protein